MGTRPDAILERLRATRFAGLAGTSASVRLVIDQGLANELLARDAVPHQSALRALELTFTPGNLVDVRAKPALPLLPAVSARIEIAPSVALAPEPVLTFRFKKEGTSSMLAALLPQIAGRLPPGVRVDASGGSVALASLLARWQLEWMLPYLVRAEVETLEAQLIVTVDLQI